MGKVINYRLLYEKATLYDVPVSFEIHHIDGNRENNQLRNLVALPLGLHKLYHDKCWCLQYTFNVPLLGLLDGGSNYNSFYIEQAVEAVKIWNDCQKWVDFRDHLIGLLPNIHNLSYQ